MRSAFLRSRPWLGSGVLHAAILLALGMCTFVCHDVDELHLEMTFEDGGSEHLEFLEIPPPEVPPAEVLTASSVPPPDGLPEFDLPLFAGDGSAGLFPVAFHSRSGSEGEALSARSIEFYGAVAEGDRAAFVLDASGSMGHSPRNRDIPSRFQLAAEELMRAVERLYPEQSFCVVLFDHQCHPMFDVPQKATQLVPANDANKNRLRQWLATVQPTGGTDPRESLKLAVDLGPDLIFLLTDGEFRDYSGQRRAIHLDFPRINVTQIPIHAIAFKVRRRQRALMRMAEDSGGTYRFVP